MDGESKEGVLKFTPYETPVAHEDMAYGIQALQSYLRDVLESEPTRNKVSRVRSTSADVREQIRQQLYAPSRTDFGNLRMRFADGLRSFIHRLDISSLMLEGLTPSEILSYDVPAVTATAVGTDAQSTIDELQDMRALAVRLIEGTPTEGLQHSIIPAFQKMLREQLLPKIDASVARAQAEVHAAEASFGSTPIVHMGTVTGQASIDKDASQRLQ